MKTFAPSETFQEIIKQKFRYDPETGLLYRRTIPKTYYRKYTKRNGDVSAYCFLPKENEYKEKVVGRKRKIGYLSITVDLDGERYCSLVHRFAWFLHYGTWVPDGYDIDHINRNNCDNRIVNLRLATRSQNVANAPSRKNRLYSKYKGVGFLKRTNSWVANITVNKVKHNLGYFDSEEDSARAFNHAARKFCGEFAYINDVSDPFKEVIRRKRVVSSQKMHASQNK